jgi:VCBS repeat-containing protein
VSKLEGVTATVTVTIDPVNDAPAAVNDVNATPEDTPLTGSVATNDTPSGDGGNTWSLVGINGGAVHGTVTMNADGTYLYTPAANYTGSDTFLYQLCDVSGDCSVATVTLTVSPVNDLPLAMNDAAATPENTRLRGSVAGNDTPSGDGGNVWSLVETDGGALHGTVTMSANGSFTYTPVASYFGPDAFTYQLCDANGDCSTATVALTVNNAGHAPQALDDSNITPEDTPINGNVSLNDIPSKDGGNSWSLIGTNGGALHGTVTMNIDGTYTYTPNANFNGTDVFTYQVCDVNSNCSVATVTLNITVVDDIPVAVDDVISTPEDVTLRGSVASNDAPSGDGGNTWSLVGTNGGALHGTLILNTDGTFTYVPEANYFGNDEFTYQLCDGDGDCSVGTVSITINNVNDLPVALNDVASTPEDTNMNGSVIGNDIASGDGGNAWSLVGLNGGASHGTVTMTADGRYTYSPAANFNGTDIFTYHMCDATGDCSTATVTINVTSQNDAPVAVNDTGTTLEDNALNSTVATNDSPSGDGGNAWSLVGRNGGALHGTVVMNLDGTYTYTPRANYNGTDEFTYQLCDLNGDCSVAAVSLTIISVNDLPVAVDDIVSMPEDTRLKGSVVGNDTPSGDGGNIWTLIGTNGGATHGVLTMGTGGRFIYTPDADYYGTDTFSYKLCDVDSDCSTASVTINIDPVDDAPVAVNDVSITAEDTPVSGNVSTNDTPSGDGGNRWSLAGTNGGAAHGTVIMNADGTYTYTPNANYNGADVFVYQLMDADGDVSVATVTITIIAVNDVPVAVNDAASTPKDTELDESVAGNDTPSGDGGNVWSLVGVNGGATHGTVSMGNSGTYIYTPASGYFGADVFIYQVCDVDGNCSSALVTVTVNPVGDAPQAFDDADSTPEDNAVNGNVSSNDVPSADGGNTWSLVGTNGGAANGTVTMAADGTYIYTPNANFNGTDTFIYQLCDANGDCSVATVALTITSVNDLPVAVNDGASTPEDIAINGSVAINDNPSGEGGNVWSLVGANGGASHGTVSMTSDGRYTYTPNANFNGNDSFTYKLCDVNGDCSTATVSMSIDAVDDAPVAVNDTNTCLEDESVSGSVTGNDTPSGDGGNVWRLVGINGGAANGTVTMRTDGSYTYIPEANYHGIDVFTYEVCDIDRDCSVATVTIDVISINDVPLAENDTTQTPENIPVYGTIVGNDSPSGDGGNTWNLIGPNGGAQHGTVTLGTAGANSSALVLHLVKSVFGISSTNAGYGTYYVYYPNTNYTGTDVFTYEVCDGSEGQMGLSSGKVDGLSLVS